MGLLVARLHGVSMGLLAARLHKVSMGLHDARLHGVFTVFTWSFSAGFHTSTAIIIFIRKKTFMFKEKNVTPQNFI